MNVDVTNTQTGGNEPVAKAEDFKANITPAKQEEPAQAEAQQTEPPVESVQPTATEPPVVSPTEPPVFPIGKMEGPVATPAPESAEIPEPIDIHSFDSIDYGHINSNVGDTEQELTYHDDTKQEEITDEKDPLFFFNSLDIDGNKNQNDPEKSTIEAITPPVGVNQPAVATETKPRFSTTGNNIEVKNEDGSISIKKEGEEQTSATEVVPTVVSPAQQVGVHTIGDAEFKGVTEDGKPKEGTYVLPDGTETSGRYDEKGQLTGVGSVKVPDGTHYVGSVKDGKANGIGVVTDKNGVEKTVTIKDGVVQNEIATSKPKGSEPTEIKAAFKPKDYSTIYATEDKQKEDVAPAKVVDEGNRTFQAMQAITDKEIYDIAKGTVEFIDEKKEAERVNVKAVVRGINEIITPDVQKRIRNGGILTNDEKLKLQEVLKGFDNSKLQKQAKENEVKGDFGAKILLGNAHPLAGDYSNFLGTNTKTLLKTIYGINKQGKQILAELDKPQPVQQKTVGEQVEANLMSKAKNVIKGNESKYNPYTGEMGQVTYDAEYSAKVKGVVDYIMSPKYNDFIKSELTTGDRVVNDKKLDLMLRGGNPNGKYIVNEGTRKEILELHQDAIEIQLSKVTKSKNQYGLAKAQSIIAIDNKNLEDKKTDLITDVHGKVSPYYINKKIDAEKKMKETYESELSNMQASSKEFYNTAIKSLSESNSQIKSLYQEYNQKMINASSEERETLSTELKGKLSKIPEYQELNKTYTEHIKTETDKLNKTTELAQIGMIAELRDEYIKDFNNNYTNGLKKLERQSGYLAQYNVYNQTEALQETTGYKKADYQTKKVMTENLWNKHVADATEFFAGTGVPTPKNEDERLNKHFTQWTGPLRPKTSEDMAVYSHLISKAAHDKFRVYSNYDAISDEKGNAFQYKAILEDSKAEIVANMKYLETTLGKEAYHNERYAKWKHQLEIVQDGIDRPENEQNTFSAFVKGFAEADIPFIGGIFRSYEADRLSQAAKNYSNGTASRADAGLLLTKTVKGTLDNFTPTSFIHGFGTGIGSTLSIMSELAVIEGAGNLTFKATGEILGKLAAESATTTAKIGITEAVLEAGKAGLINPETVKFTQQVINIASRGSNGLARIFLTASAQPGTTASLKERVQQNVNETMVALHAGVMDDAIAKMEKGHEGELEAVAKSFGASLISTGAEIGGAAIMKNIDNVVGKKIMDYMSSNQFFKRNVVGAFMRKKGFTNADELTNYIDKVREAGKIGELHHEMLETYIEATGTNIIEGDDWAKGYGDGTQASTVLFTSALFGGASKAFNVTKKIVVKSNPTATHVYFDMEDGEKTSTAISTEAWNYFNNQVGKEHFNSNAFLDFADKAKLTLPQKTALAQIYVKVNPNAHNDIKNIQANVEKMTGEKVTEEQIQGGTVEVVNQEFEPKEQTTETTSTETELTSREKEEQVKIREEKDAKIQVAIDKEIKRLENRLEGENIPDFYKTDLELLKNNPIEYFQEKAELFSKYMSTKITGSNDISADELNRRLSDEREYQSELAREYADIVAALREQQKEKQEPRTSTSGNYQEVKNPDGTISMQPINTETNDNQNQAGIPSEVGGSQESVPNNPNQEAGNQEIASNRVVQKPSEEVSSIVQQLKKKDLSEAEKILGIESNWDMRGEGDLLSGEKSSKAYTQRMLPEWNRAEQTGQINPNSKLTYGIKKGEKSPDRKLPNGTILKGIKTEDKTDTAYAYDENGVIIGMVQIDDNNGIKHLAVAPEFRGKDVVNNLVSELKKQNPNLDLSKTELRSKGFTKSLSPQIIAEQYIKAKQENSNPELIKFVESKINESTTSTNTPTDGNIQPTVEQSTQTGQSETVQPTTEPTASQGNVEVDDTPTKVTETKTVLSDDTKFKERKEQREAKELEALPLLEVTEDNPFHAERQAGKNAIKKQKFRKQYQSEINEIKEINDNFESIVEQLNLKTKDC